jgi:hypothetical protein
MYVRIEYTWCGSADRLVESIEGCLCPCWFRAWNGIGTSMISSVQAPNKYQNSPPVVQSSGSIQVLVFNNCYNCAIHNSRWNFMQPIITEETGSDGSTAKHEAWQSSKRKWTGRWMDDAWTAEWATSWARADSAFQLFSASPLSITEHLDFQSVFMRIILVKTVQNQRKHRIGRVVTIVKKQFLRPK